MRQESDCRVCGKRISFHPGSGKWNHVSTEDAAECSGAEVDALLMAESVIAEQSRRGTQAFDEGFAEGLEAMEEFWEEAIGHVLLQYPESVFIPGGTSSDAQAADMVRLTCKNIRRVFAELTDTGEEARDLRPFPSIPAQ